VDARERVSHIVLDAALHAVPHDSLSQWFPDVAPMQVAYPSRIERFTMFADAPTSGMTEVRVRPAGYANDSPRTPRLQIQFLHAGTVWAELTLVEVCLPATRLGALPGPERRAFLRDGTFVADARLSDERDGVTTLTARSLGEAEWLPGTVAAIYGLTRDEPLTRVAAVAAREHAAQRLRVHPRSITVSTTGEVTSAQLPLLDYRVAVQGSMTEVTVTDVAPPRIATA